MRARNRGMKDGRRKLKGERTVANNRQRMLTGVKRAERRNGGLYCASAEELIGTRLTVSVPCTACDAGRAAARNDSYCRLVACREDGAGSAARASAPGSEVGSPSKKRAMAIWTFHSALCSMGIAVRGS